MNPLDRIKKIKSEKTSTMQQQLFSSYFIIAAGILLFFSIIFSTYISSLLTDEGLDNLSYVNRHFLESTDSILNNLDSTSANINYSALLQEKLSDSFELELDSAQTKEWADLFVTINGTDIKADQINLFDNDGHVMRSGISTGIYSVDMSSLDWMDKVTQSGGIKVISTPYLSDQYSKSISSPEWYISLYRTSHNRYGRSIGYIETIKRCKALFKAVIKYEKTAENPALVYIFNEEGSLVYPYNISDDEVKIGSHYYNIMKNTASGSRILSPDGAKQWIVYETSAYSGWTYCSIQNQNILLNPVYKMLATFFVIVLAMVLISSYIAYKLSAAMVRPIKHLKHRIQRLEISNLGVEEPEYATRYSELQKLYEAFEDMSNKLELSMHQLVETKEQEARARALALQAQINPHFYYNTLSSIMILAENGKSDEVAALCQNLSRIMRYVSDASSTTVPMKTEIDYISQYLYCMKVRYQDSLTVTLDIPQELMDIPIPKLLIQPIVENALKYGTDCLPPWSITIRGTGTPEEWKIEVIDSGNGFSPRTLETIRAKMRSVEERDFGIGNLKIDGLGIVNVFARWKLMHGDRVSFEIGNTEDNHGIVSIGLAK